MTGHERQDERMIEWLSDGPWAPPVDVLETAVAYARSHPRRAPRFAGLRRSIMSGIRLTPVQRHPSANRSTYLALAAMAAVVVVSVGLAFGTGMLGGPSTPAGGVGVSSPSPSPTQTATPAATLAALPADLHGNMTYCTVVSAGSTQSRDAVTQTRGLRLRCTLTSTDPRVGGTAVLAYNDDVPEDGAFDTWGQLNLTDSRGTWRGMWRGTAEGSLFVRHHTLTGVLVGSGEYDGLRIRWTMENRSPGGSGLNNGVDLTNTKFFLAGVLETVDTIPPDGTTLISGSSTCRDVEPGDQTEVDGVTQMRGVVVVCSGNVGSDPRLDGVGRTEINGNQQPDGSAEMWGFEEVSVGGDLRWRGEYSGTVAVGFTTHRFEGTSAGYGPYAGLVYRWTMIGDPSSGYVTSGVIVPAP